MSETQPPIRKPRRRWRRRLAVTSLLLPVFMVGGLWMSQRWWLPMVVRPGVERLTGMQFDAATMRIGPDGRIRINRPSLRDHDHEATVTATALDARINWRSAWGGRIDIHDVVVHDPVLTMDIAFTSAMWDRLSPATEPHEQEWLTSLPEISLVGAVLELTETTPQGRELIVSMRGDGSLAQRTDDPGVYDISFEQTGAADQIHFSGSLDLPQRRAVLRAQDITFTNWIAAFSIPHQEEFWRSIVTEGELVAAEVEIDGAGRVVSHLDVEGVRLELPTPRSSDIAHERLVLESVSGRVFLQGLSLRANLAGLIDGLPTAATFEAQSLSLTTPFRCDLVGGPFMIDQHWKPLALAPTFVRRVLEDFSGPSAEVTASIELSRAQASAAPDEGISVAGEARVEHGSATFMAFPYPMREVAGTVRFNEELIELINLSGVGLSGAALRGEGTLTPVPGSVVLDLMIWGEQAPIDEALLGALDDHERSIVESLFSQSAADELAAQGIVATSAQHAAAQAAIADLSSKLSTALEAGASEQAALIRSSLADLRTVTALPTFDAGGLVDVQARVQWDGRRTRRHQVEVDVHFDRAGLIYEHFPYPVVLEPLEARIDLNGVELTRAPIAGLTGAIGEIRGSVSYDRDSVRPDLTIEFSHLPVDAPILSAVSLATRSTEQTLKSSRGGVAGQSPVTVSNALQRFGAHGAVRGGGRVTNDAEGVTWSVDVPLEGLALRSAANSGVPVVTAERFMGNLDVSPGGWRVNDASAHLGQSAVEFSIEAPRDGDVEISFASDAFDLSVPFEGFLQELDSRSTAAVARARSQYDVRGPVKVEGSAVVSADDPRYEVKVAGAGELSLQLGERVARLAPRGGEAVFHEGGVTFSDVKIELLDPLGGSSGVVSIDGALTDAADESSLNLTATDVAIESPLVQRVLSLLHPEAEDWLESARPFGRIGATMTVATRDDDSVAVMEGVVEPKSLHFTLGHERIELDNISGSFTLAPGGGKVQQLQIRSANWSAHLDGDWYAGETPGVDLRVSARGDSLQQDVIALLPDDVQDVFQILNIRVDEGFELHDAELAINAPVDGQDLGDGFRDGVRFVGNVSCVGAAIDAGVKFSEISGDVVISASRAPFSSATRIDVGLRLDHAKAAGLTLENVEAAIRSANDAHDVLEINLLGESHDGRIWGQGEIRAREGTDGPAAGYRFDLRMAGLDLATAMHEYAGAARSDTAPEIKHRGHVDASLVLSGDLSAASQPRGAGEIRILGGELARLPLVITVLELGNLIPPIGEKLDYARADFSLAHGIASFDRLLVVSPSMALVGEGDVKLPEFALDLRFGASGNYRLPIFSSIFDVVRNEILTTRVRGTLGAPEFSLEQLSATRRLFSRIFGAPADDDRQEKSVAGVSEPPN